MEARRCSAASHTRPDMDVRAQRQSHRRVGEGLDLERDGRRPTGFGSDDLRGRAVGRLGLASCRSRNGPAPRARAGAASAVPTIDTSAHVALTTATPIRFKFFDVIIRSPSFHGSADLPDVTDEPASGGG